MNARERAQRDIKVVKEYPPNLGTNLARIAAEAIEYDIGGRKGIGHELAQVSDSIRDEDIKPAWQAIIEEAYSEQTKGFEQLQFSLSRIKGHLEQKDKLTDATWTNALKDEVNEMLKKFPITR